MIWSVKGPVVASGLDWVAVETGGIALKILVPSSLVASRVGSEELRVFTEMVVREDSMTLYGFADPDGRDTFVVLLGVSGIGPRTALAALSVMTPAELREAIESGDETTLTRIPGVGKKSAQRMLLELGGKLPQPGDAAGATPGGVRGDVESALEGLGWTKSAVTATLEQIAQPGMDAAELLRLALQSLGGTRG